MRKVTRKIIVIFTVFCMMFSALPLPVQAAAPAITKKSITLTVGKSTTLKVKNTRKKVKWKSSNSKIASVNSAGKVTGKKAGRAKITATVNKKKYTCTVTVKAAKKAVKVSKIKLNKNRISLNTGKSYTLKAAVSPSKASNKKLSWKSSNTAVVTVNSKGVVIAKKAGSAVITATAKDGSRKKASCKVTVKGTSKKDTRVSKLIVSSKKSVNVNGTLQLSVSVHPSGLSKTFTWKSDNTKIATVSSSGLVTGISAGTVKISVTTNDKWKDSVFVYINVNKPQSTPAPEKKVTGIEASCRLSEITSVNDVNSSNLTVYEKYSDGTKAELKNFLVKGEYDFATGYYRYTITKTGTAFSTVVTVKKQVTEKVLVGISAKCTLSEVASIDELEKHLVVTGHYSDGSTEELKSYKITGATGGDPGAVVEISTVDDKFTTTASAKWKDEITLKGIEASCKLSEVESGYNFKTSDFDVKGVYSDGTKKEIGFKVAIEYSNGAYRATITARGFTKALSIPVKKSSAPEVTSLTYTLSPSYVYVGENLASGQLKVTAKYSDGSQKEVTDYSCNFKPQSAAGICSFNVSWGTFKKSISITVKEKATPIPTLTGLDAQYTRSYVYADEPFDASCIVLTGTYSDGSSKQITDYTYDFTPASDHLGKAILVIHYAGKDMTIRITSIVKTEPKSVEFKFMNVPISVGENIDKNNITVTATDYAGNVTNPTDFTIDFTPKSEPGTYPFTVTYKGFTESFDIAVR